MAGQGRRGSEKLTILINRCFEKLVGIVQSYGGDITNFSGDAFLALFPFEQGSTSEVVQQVVSCALTLQAAMQDYVEPTLASLPDAPKLSIKLGLGIGKMLLTSVGQSGQQLAYLVGGSAVDRCLRAEKQASQGEIWGSDQLWAYLPQVQVAPSKKQAETEAGFSRVCALPTKASSRPVIAQQYDPRLEDLLKEYLHPTLTARLVLGQNDFINEHRSVTTLFVNFQAIFDFDNQPQIVANQLQNYFSQVISIIGRYGGYLSRIDVGAEGGRYLALFGAPILHEDDQLRALHCAVELSEIANISLRLGITTGRVFAGSVGAQSRQEYTVMGDVVTWRPA